MRTSPAVRCPSTPPLFFHLFPQLHTEIRLAIYELSLPGPRLVPGQYQSRTYSGGLDTVRRSQRGCTSPAPIPALLHVCHEARTLALEHYALSFQLCGPPGIFPGKVWYRNDGEDVLYFGPRRGLDTAMECFKHFVNFTSIVDRKELRKVRRLAVHEGLFLERRTPGRKARRRNHGVPDLSLREFWSYVRERFTNVEEIFFLRHGTEKHIGTSTPGPLIESPASWDATFGTDLQTLEEPMQDISTSTEPLKVKIHRALTTTQEETEWTPPRWCVVGMEGISSPDIAGYASMHGAGEVEVELEAMQLDEKTVVDCFSTMSKTDLLFLRLCRAAEQQSSTL